VKEEELYVVPGSSKEGFLYAWKFADKVFAFSEALNSHLDLASKSRWKTRYFAIMPKKHKI
jgi:hypothetical protein